jgi:hypothetical protein
MILARESQAESSLRLIPPSYFYAKYYSYVQLFFYKYIAFCRNDFMDGASFQGIFMDKMSQMTYSP